MSSPLPLLLSLAALGFEGKRGSTGGSQGSWAEQLQSSLDLEDWEFAEEEETEQVESEEGSGTNDEAMFFSVECEDEDDEHNHKRSHEDDEQRSGADSVIVKDWIEPWPLERAGEQRKGKITSILEALHQFQHNPNIQIFITMMSQPKWRQEDIPLKIASMGGCLIWLLLIRK
ncbi:unnamed protein product [Sphagnum troendelagicum]|uniref:Uncharacterized protein n=1 Tax=Sphagnum troendelagicum TaxID=128251 RepID=A0ABP0U3J0_9BRYO